MNPSDEWDVAAVRAGETELRAAFVDRRYVELFRWLHWLTGSRDEAADLTQETFLKFWDSLSAADPSAKAHVWLFAVARNVWRSACRNRNRPLQFSTEAVARARQVSGPTDAPQTLMAAECQAAVRRAVAELAVDLREAVTLRYWQDYSYNQIAEVLSITPELARQRTFQGRRHLRRTLRDWAPGGAEMEAR